jgi:hypothetical protein
MSLNLLLLLLLLLHVLIPIQQQARLKYIDGLERFPSVYVGATLHEFA